MRLIDADAVDYENIACSQNDLHWLNRIIEEQPTIEVPRWIPVTERLPTWEDGNKYGGILAVRRGHELSDFYHCNDVKENPDEFTHWMPLPTPPKDGE